MLNTLPRIYLLLFNVWLLIQFFLLYNTGILTTGEAPKYFNEATYFITHHTFSEPKYLFYSGYIFLHILMLKIHAGATGMYIAQLLFNLLSVYCFFRLTLEIIQDRIVATLFTFLLLICFPWQQWVTYLYTESIFTSLVIIFSFLLFTIKRYTIPAILLIAFTFLMLVFTRPTGLLIIPVVLFLIIRRWLLQKRIVLASTVAISITGIFVVTVNYAMQGKGEFDFLKPFIEEHIICGVPTAQNTQLTLPQNGNSLGGLFYYMLHNPEQFLRLGIQKLVAFFGMTRSYYSATHNLYLMLFFYPLYILALAGAVYLRNINKLYNHYWLGISGIFTLSVLVTCDEWSNRFIMPIIPFIIVAAAAGTKYFMQSYRNRKADQ